MEIKVNDYVRFYDKGWTEIGQIVGEVEDSHLKIVKCRDGGYYDLGDFIKSSPQIIDLIKIGDYVNGSKVTKLKDELVIMNTGLIYDNNLYIPIKNITIKSIVTKEMFEQMEYKVGE